MIFQCSVQGSATVALQASSLLLQTHKNTQVSDSYSSGFQTSYWRGTDNARKRQFRNGVRYIKVEEFCPWHVPNIEEVGLKESKPKQLEGSTQESCKLTQSKKDKGNARIVPLWTAAGYFFNLLESLIDHHLCMLQDTFRLMAQIPTLCSNLVDS